ncbi:unnamed protein product [Somion occarium]|uniref:GMC oxidoreductase n=1 Tax=Somion occarium TaxID=3059160 RepID=A0ABP1D3K3_9APHY
MGSWFSKSPYVSNPSDFATTSTSADPGKWKQYDYIVVGGGTAGCVLASRLSEDRDVTVLLIEAGTGRGNVFTKAPLAFTKNFKTSVDWEYYNASPHVRNGEETYLARGKMLGGTSALNALIYDRCSPEDYDSWAKAGCNGWTFKELEPYFRKAEGYSPKQITNIDLSSKGTTGPWKIRQTPSPAPISDVIMETCKEIGIPYVEDLNSPDREVGVGHLAGIVDEHGNRVSTASAYLTPEVLSRSNLTVAVNTYVEKILFSEEKGSPRAVGVQVASSASGPKYRVAATREVILAAGVVSSPHLLFVSGVGAKEELSAASVPVVKDVPAVGKHLADHISSGPLIFRAKPGVTLDKLNSSLLAGASAFLKWLWNGTGPFASMGVTSVAFIRSDDIRFIDTSLGPVKDLTSGPKSPDLELMWTPAIIPSFFDNARPGEHGFTIPSILLKPESKGIIHFKSGSIYDKPTLAGNYLDSESDLNVVARGVRCTFKLAHSEPLKSLLEFNPNNSDKSDYFWFGDQDPSKVTDDDIREFIKRNGHTAFHPVGTCRMGTDPQDSVLDPNLRVHGVTGLRVVDTSVFPTQVSGHPQGPVVAIAEKAADMIKADRQI